MDYQLPVTTLTFPTGSQRGARQCVNVAIDDDPVVEDSESFRLQLSTDDENVELSSNCNLAQFLIYDNDGESRIYCAMMTKS